jgi:hypothetical protein
VRRFEELGEVSIDDHGLAPRAPMRHDPRVRDRVREGWTIRFGTLADGERWAREDAAAMTPEEGLAALEALRSAQYADPEHPPRLERVLVLSETPWRAVRRRRLVRPRDPR